MTNFAEKSNKISNISSFLSSNDTALLEHLEKSIIEYKKERQISQIPIRLFAGKLAAQEVIVKYLFESGLTYAQISKILGRDQRTIWTAYSKAIKKQKAPFITKNDDLLVDIKIFRERKSPLKILIMHLISRGHTLKQIASLLNRSYKNIWMISHE